MLVKSASAKREESHSNYCRFDCLVKVTVVLTSKIMLQCIEGPAWLESSERERTQTVNSVLVLLLLVKMRAKFI